MRSPIFYKASLEAQTVRFKALLKEKEIIKEKIKAIEDKLKDIKQNPKSD